MEALPVPIPATFSAEDADDCGGPLTGGKAPDGEVQVDGSAIRIAGERSEKLW